MCDIAMSCMCDIATWVEFNIANINICFIYREYLIIIEKPKKDFLMNLTIWSKK